MKRISIVLSIGVVLGLIFAFFGARTAEANIYDSGCFGSNLYSITTGIPCNTNYNYNYNQNNTYIPSGADSSYLFVRELGVGTRGEDVTALQQILQAKGYSPGVLDGVYGNRTRLAVMNYQQTKGLSTTGRADWNTLSNLSSNTNNPVNPVYPIDPVCPMVYPSNCYPNYNINTPTSAIFYLAPNYGRVGTAVTIYGRNFAYNGNTVNFGGTQIANIYSWNSTSLTFNVPKVPQIYCFQAPCVQNFNVSVAGTNGVSSNLVIYTVIQ